MEKCFYKELKDEVIRKIYINQVGFIGVEGTEVNLFRLREKCIQLKKTKSENIFDYL